MDNSIRYLYGAAVQGIQNFIFQTNQLQDIIGASELVENICSTAFDEYGKNCGTPVVRAAGNIKHIFDNKEDCKKAVLEFPKKVMTMAPGITVSQAVVALDGSMDFGQAVEELEARLRIQRNKPSKNLNFCYSGVLRSRKTGLPVVKVTDSEFIDMGTDKKRAQISSAKYNLCNKFFGCDINHKDFAYNIDDITGHNDWIAIIHADGNGLGQVVQKIGKSEDSLKEFSYALGQSTQNAAQNAFSRAIQSNRNTNAIPFRPIILGGDDLTVICKGDLAIPFTKYFLGEFEMETKKNIGNILKSCNCSIEYLTACAGIAFIKSSYPFYYGYNLAETLCSEAKKNAKAPGNLIDGLAPSCLMFHKVQDSFVESYEEIVKRELTLDQGKTLKFGPYYLSGRIPNNHWNIDRLISSAKLLEDEDGNAFKSGLRQWLSLAYQSIEKAEQKKSRLEKIIPHKFVQDLSDFTNPDNGRYPVYDILCLNTINNQKTNL